MFLGQALGSGTQTAYTSAGMPATGPQNPVNAGQLNSSFDYSYAGLDAQKALMQAMQSGGVQGMANQGALSDMLNNQAQGMGPNPAQAQYQQNINDAAAQQAGAIASQKGISPALATRMIAQQGGAAKQAAAGQAATLQAQQQLAAQQNLANLSGQQIGQQAGATNAYDQSAQNNQGLLLGAIGNYQNAGAGVINSSNQVQSQIAIQNAKAQQGLFGGLLGGAGSILSDENVKTDIKSADGKIKDFLDQLGAHQYKYKESVEGKPGAAPGKHTGPMAQELEKSELGKEMVVDTPDGKGVDFARGLSTILAAQAQLNKRLEAVEKGKPQKMAEGGEVGYAGGGEINAYSPLGAAPTQPAASSGFPAQGAGPQSSFGKFVNGFNQSSQPTSQMPMMQGEDRLEKGANEFANAIGKNYIKPLLQKGYDSIFSSHENVGQGPTVQNAQQLTDQSAIPQGSAPGNFSQVNQGNYLFPGAPEDAGAAEGASGAGAAEGAEGAEGASAAEGAGSAASAGEAAEGAEAVEGAEGASSIADLAAALAKGGQVNMKDRLKAGGQVPGKAKFKGDNYKNDVVDAKLSKGEIVIPNSVIESQDPVGNSAKFVAAVLAKKRMKK